MARQTPKIQWLASDFPPCHYHDKANIGYCDEIGHKLFSELDEYEFVKNVSSLARYKALMKTDRQFCTLELLYSEQRAQYLHFSEPLYPVLPVGLITKADSSVAKLLSQHKRHERLTQMARSSFKIGVVEGRFYGKDIDSYLTTLQEHAYSANNYRAIIQLLKADKIDLTFFNPVELPIYDPDEEFAFFQVGQSPLLLTYLTCTKSEMGNNIINKVNLLLSKEGFQDLHLPYLQRLRNKEKPVYQTLLHSQCKKYEVVEPCPYK